MTRRKAKANKKKINKKVKELLLQDKSCSVVKLTDDVSICLDTNIYIDGEFVDYDSVSEGYDDKTFKTIEQDLYIVILNCSIRINHLTMFNYDNSILTQIKGCSNTSKYTTSTYELYLNEEYIQTQLIDMYSDFVGDSLEKLYDTFTELCKG